MVFLGFTSFSALACSRGDKFVVFGVISFKFSCCFNKSSWLVSGFCVLLFSIEFKGRVSPFVISGDVYKLPLLSVFSYPVIIQWLGNFSPFQLSFKPTLIFWYSIATLPFCSTLTPLSITSGIVLITFRAYSLASVSFSPLLMACSSRRFNTCAKLKNLFLRAQLL